MNDCEAALYSQEPTARYFARLTPYHMMRHFTPSTVSRPAEWRLAPPIATSTHYPDSLPGVMPTSTHYNPPTTREYYRMQPFIRETSLMLYGLFQTVSHLLYPQPQRAKRVRAVALLVYIEMYSCTGNPGLRLTPPLRTAGLHASSEWPLYIQLLYTTRKCSAWTNKEWPSHPSCWWLYTSFCFTESDN